MSKSKADEKIKSIKEWRAKVFPNQSLTGRDDESRLSPIEAAVTLANRAVENLRDDNQK